MIDLFTAFLLAVGPPESVSVHVTGREMSAVQHYESVIRGTCDGRPTSLRITMATRGRPGSLVLRGGRFERELPPRFLDGALVTNGHYYTGLACDGQRLQLSGEAVRDGGDEIILVRQNAVLDLRNGSLSLTELRRLSTAETRSELTGGHDVAIDDEGRLRPD
jgi:hypothetical protein